MLFRSIGGVQFHSAARHVHAVAVPAGAHGRIGVVMSLGVIFARFKEECHLLVGDLEEFASLFEGVIGATVAVKGIVSLALASRVVEEGEEGNNGRISASSPAQIETEPLHALPVIGAVDGGKNQFGLGGDMGPRFATAGRSRDHTSWSARTRRAQGNDLPRLPETPLLALLLAAFEPLGQLLDTLGEIGSLLDPLLSGGRVGAPPAGEHSAVHLGAPFFVLNLPDPLGGEFRVLALTGPGKAADGGIEVGGAGE